MALDGIGLRDFGIGRVGGYGDRPTSGVVDGDAKSTGRAEALAGAEGTGVRVNPEESDVKLPGHRSSPAECETCKNRKYQDGSDEMVSFKSASHISPTEAPARVRGHEQEHVSNAYKKAAQGGGKVLRASVAIHTAVCPECGRTYVAGGTTTTQIMYPNEKEPYQHERKEREAAGIFRGANFDQGF